MKKMLLSLCGVVAIYAASAQISVGANANYTMYKGDFQQSTPGIGVRGYYEDSYKLSFSLGFTYGMPIKTASSIMVSNGTTAKNVATEMNYNFKAINVMCNYTFVGSEESAGKFYGSFGSWLVLVGMKEKAKESYDATYTPTTPLYKENVNGFTVNLGLGGEYKIGTPSIFLETGIMLPANKVNDAYVENPIPAHFVINAGVKFPLGSRE